MTWKENGVMVFLFFNWSLSLSSWLELYYLDPVFIAVYYETDVMLYCVWNLFLELGQVQ